MQKIYATGSEPKEQDGILPLCSRVPPRTWELQYKEQAKLAMLLLCSLPFFQGEGRGGVCFDYLMAQQPLSHLHQPFVLSLSKEL